MIFRLFGKLGMVGEWGEVEKVVFTSCFSHFCSAQRGGKKNQFWVHRYAHFRKFYDQNRKERIFAFNQCDWGSMSIIWDGKNAIFFFFLMVSLGYG